MEYILIGVVVNTHGIKGELRIKSDFEKKDLIFKDGFNFYIGDSKSKMILKSHRIHKNLDMLTFNDIDNINQVLEFKGQKIYVLRSDLNLNENDYVLNDIIDFDVYEKDDFIGKIKDFMYNKAQVLLQVEFMHKIYYIPLIEHYLVKVDLENKKVIVKNSKGLIL